MQYFQNRFLIDYCQYVIFNLLYRTDQAPFIGDGEKYFSIIDDTEIEIMKCLWIGIEQYRNDPSPRRVWGSDFFDKEKFIKLTENTVSALKELEENRTLCDNLIFTKLDRAVFFMLAIQMKEWKNIYFYSGFQKAFNSVINYLGKYDHFSSYIERMRFFNVPEKMIDFRNCIVTSEPVILISNVEIPEEMSLFIKEKNPNVKKIISYQGAY